jgi:exosortase/archaeosortase family protein
VSLTLTTESNLRTQASVRKGNLTVPQFSFLLLLLALGAVAADQFVAPSIYSSSPLWAIAACLALVWRRGGAGFEPAAGTEILDFSFARVGLFAVAHVLLVSAARILHGTMEPIAGTVFVAGWLTAALKLSVLLPTLLLLPWARWRILSQVYSAEGIAALVVLFTFFPSRILATIWPWYGQALGRLVFVFSGFFVHGLTYNSALAPSLHGPVLDVTILLACSGIAGIELFDYLFALVVILDWNRLRKGPTLIAYFAGIAAMFAGNALRISTFVILGNRGFADAVARFHLSAGWIFFSLVFLAYLSFTYRKLLASPR